MELQEFMDKWGVDRVAMAELLRMSQAQMDRHFFAEGTKNRQELKQSHKDRLGEIDIILTMRSYIKALGDSEAIERLNRIIPPTK